MRTVNDGQDGQVWPALGWVDVGAGISASVVALVLLREFALVISPDSVSYLAAARSLMAGHGLLDLSGLPLTTWPPGYPVLLGVAGVILGDIVRAAVAINVLAVAGVAILASVLIRTVASNRWIRLAGVVSVVFSPALIAVSGAMWSDAVFALLVLVALTALSRFLSEGRPLLLYVAAVATAAASLTRYVGVTVVIAGVLVLLAVRPVSWVKARQAATFASMSLIPIAVVLAWNLLNTGTAFGTGRISCVRVLPVTLQIIGTVTRWWLVPIRNIQLAGVVGSIILAVVLLIVWRHRSTAEPRHDTLARPVLFVMSLYVLTYLVVLAAASLLSDLDSPDDRLLAPVYVPTLILLAAVLDGWLAQMHKGDRLHRAWLVRAATLAAVGVLALLPVAQVLGSYNARTPVESVDMSQISRSSSFASFLESWSRQREERVYSNDAVRFFLITGNPVHGVPGADVCTRPEPHSQAVAIERMEAEAGGPAYLVWFGILDEDQIQRLRGLGAEIVFSDADGSLWMLPN